MRYAWWILWLAGAMVVAGGWGEVEMDGEGKKASAWEMFFLVIFTHSAKV